MRFLVVSNGRSYDTLQWADGVNPDAIIDQNYPPKSGWIFVGVGTSLEEATSIIEKDRAIHRVDSY